jgi:hypothetical protein
MMAATLEIADAYVVTNENFSFWTLNQDYRTTGLTLGNLNWQKWVSRDFSKNNLSYAIKQHLSWRNYAILSKMSGSTRVTKRVGCDRNGTSQVRMESLDELCINYVA